MKTQEEIRAEAKSYVKTLPALNYKSAYDFGMQNITAFENGYTQALTDMQQQSVDVETLRSDFFKHCTEPVDGSLGEYSVRRVCMAPHDLFEWIKTYLQPAPQSDSAGLTASQREFLQYYTEKINTEQLSDFKEAEDVIERVFIEWNIVRNYSEWADSYREFLNQKQK